MWIDGDPHSISVGNTMVVGGKVVAIDVDLVGVDLDGDGDGEEATRQQPSVSLILRSSPFCTVGIALADDVVGIYVHMKPKTDSICYSILPCGIFRHNIDIKCPAIRGLSIDADNISR